MYNDSVLFSSNCLSTSPGVSTCNTLILSPIAVTSVNGLLGDERINITFENIMVTIEKEMIVFIFHFLA